MDNSNILYLVLFLICLALSAFFSSAETAFIALPKLELRQMVEDRVAGADRVQKVVSEPSRFLAAILLGNNLVNVAATVLATMMAVSVWGASLGMVIATFAVAVVLLVFGETAPKTFAVHHARRLTLVYVRPLEVLCLIFHPFVSSLSWIASGLTRTGGAPIPRLLISEEDIRSAIDMGEEQGVVEEDEAEILHNVFEFGDRPVREIMTPRTEVVWLEKGTKMSEFSTVYSQSPHTHYPVYEENTDSVVGILSIKEVLMARSSGVATENSVIDDLIRSAYFVPETKRMGELLSEMQTAHHRLAMVVDEFGGIAGIVTLEQLVEEIVGDIRDDLEEEDEFTTIDERTFDIDGGLRVEEANEELALGLPRGDDYDTVAGFVLSRLGRIPRVGAQLKCNGLRITVTEMRGMKIEKVRVVREETIEVSSRGENP